MVVKRLGPGKGTLITRPGDIVLTHREAWPSRFIALGQALRFRGDRRPYAHWTHVACVAGWGGELVEALGHGVERSRLSKYLGVEYHYVDVGASDHDRAQMLRFVTSCVGRPYGWAEIASLGLVLATGSNLASFGSPGTLICSGLAAQMLCRGDTVFSRDPSRMMPADVAEALRARP